MPKNSHANTSRPLTASERIRLARKRQADYRRDAARADRIAGERTFVLFDRMTRDNRGVGL